MRAGGLLPDCDEQPDTTTSATINVSINHILVPLESDQGISTDRVPKRNPSRRSLSTCTAMSIAWAGTRSSDRILSGRTCSQSLRDHHPDCFQIAFQHGLCQPSPPAAYCRPLTAGGSWRRVPAGRSSHGPWRPCRLAYLTIEASSACCTILLNGIRAIAWTSSGASKQLGAFSPTAAKFSWYGRISRKRRNCGRAPCPANRP